MLMYGIDFTVLCHKQMHVVILFRDRLLFVDIVCFSVDTNVLLSIKGCTNISIAFLMNLPHLALLTLITEDTSVQ